MKSYLWVSSIAIMLGACSTQRVPTTLKLSQDIQEVASNAVLSVISQNDLAVPTHSQNILTLGTFKTNDNTYDIDGNKVLIPRDAIIAGLYSNDGVNCTIEWRAIYTNLAEYNDQNGSLSLSSITTESLCDPLRGVKKGDRATIDFVPPINE